METRVIILLIFVLVSHSHEATILFPIANEALGIIVTYNCTHLFNTAIKNYAPSAIQRQCQIAC